MALPLSYIGLLLLSSSLHSRFYRFTIWRSYRTVNYILYIVIRKNSKIIYLLVKLWGKYCFDSNQYITSQKFYSWSTQLDIPPLEKSQPIFFRKNNISYHYSSKPNYEQMDLNLIQKILNLQNFISWLNLL